MKDITLEALPRGNSRRYQCSLTQNGIPIPDVSGWKLLFTLKRQYDDPDDKAVLRKSQNLVNSVDVMEIIPTDTETLEVRKYFYDFKVVTDDNREYTIQKGILPIDYVVTRRDA